MEQHVEDVSSDVQGLPEGLVVKNTSGDCGTDKGADCLAEPAPFLILTTWAAAVHVEETITAMYKRYMEPAETILLNQSLLSAHPRIAHPRTSPPPTHSREKQHSHTVMITGLAARLQQVGQASAEAISLLAGTNLSELQFEVLWALTDLTCAAEFTHAVIQQGAVPIIIRSLQSPSGEVCEQAAWMKWSGCTALPDSRVVFAIYIYTYTYIYIYICVRTYIYAYTYTYVYVRRMTRSSTCWSQAPPSFAQSECRSLCCHLAWEA